VPDTAGESASREILERTAALQPGDLLLVLISGGGSSLLSLTVPDVSMDDLRRVTRDLLASGAPIEQMNVVRKHLSQIAGGRLGAAAAARGARVLALIISDVTGDAPTDIASGPCTPDPSTYEDARKVLQRWNVPPPPAIDRWLLRGALGEIAETPKPGDPLFTRIENRVIATAHASLEAAAEVFRGAGVQPVILGDTITGEAREAAKVIAALVREVRAYDAPFARPVALISGGECTVTLCDGVGGRGGRCSEFLLSLAVELEPIAGVHALAADTDGIDGSEDNAGAWFSPDSLARAARAGISPRASLDAHDSYGFFVASESLVITGPTRTNVNDYRAILIS
jgi:hydroxypyruvate reductase